MNCPSLDFENSSLRVVGTISFLDQSGLSHWKLKNASLILFFSYAFRTAWPGRSSPTTVEALFTEESDFDWLPIELNARLIFSLFSMLASSIFWLEGVDIAMEKKGIHFILEFIKFLDQVIGVCNPIISVSSVSSLSRLLSMFWSFSIKCICS